MNLKTGAFRVWFYRVLVLIACTLMLVSFSLPWWTLMVDGSTLNMVYVYGYGLRHTLVQLSEYLAADVTPFYQTILAWVYIGISIGLIMLGSYLKNNRGRWFMGLVGLGYIAYALVAIFIVVSNRIADFNIILQGTSTSVYSDIQDVAVKNLASLRFGYYLAFIAAGLCIVLALLRPLIVGRSQSAD